MTELCTQRYVVKGEKIFCDKIDNIPGEWGYEKYKKRKFERQLGKPRKKFTKYKYLEKNGENHLKNITRKNLITKGKMLRKIHQRTKVDANVGNVEN